MTLLEELQTERQTRTLSISLRGSRRTALATDLDGLDLRVQDLGQQIAQDGPLVTQALSWAQVLTHQTGPDLRAQAKAHLQALLASRRRPAAQSLIKNSSHTTAVPQADSGPVSGFLARIAHEIRTPLQGVAGLAQLLRETSLSAEQRLFVETIQSSASAALVIADGILDWAKINAESQKILAEPFDLEVLLQEVSLLVLPAASAKGIRLLIDYDPCLPVQFIGDAGRVRQVLTNLVGNAVKYTPRGHVLIRVTGTQAGHGPHHLHISVEDTGAGIAPKDLAQIFDPFHQAGAPTGHGTGLGLSIAKGLVEQMHGSIWVDSEPGRGTSFGLRLPLLAAGVPTITLPPLNLRRVLVVDENPLGRSILEGQLRPLGIAATLCSSTGEAVDILKQDQGFDAVLINQSLGGDPALGLDEQIRAEAGDMPVMLLCDDAALRRDTPQAQGLAALVQRPISRNRLYHHFRHLRDPFVPKSATLDPKSGQSRPMRILVAEDNRTNQLVFQKMVRDLAIDLAFANTGREAVHLVQSFNPDLVFMDIAMPEMDGCEAAVAIRQSEAGGARLPIIALTAHAEGAELAPLLAAGIDRRMTKPLQKAALRDVMIEFCPKAAYVLPPKAELTQAGA